MIEIKYDRLLALNYATTYALKRNPLFYDFSKIGGDCTNFASQCLYAGAKTMNYTPISGWYYNSPSDRTASWTGVEYFNKFITTNKSIGPFGENVTVDKIQPADFIQLKNDNEPYHHTLIVMNITKENIYVSAHSNDAYNIPLSSYQYSSLRCIHINGVRIP